MDIKHKTWWDEALNTTAPGLERKLGSEIVTSHSIIGSVSRYFSQRYGFDPSCLVVAFSGLEKFSSLVTYCYLLKLTIVFDTSGDNPNSVAGMKLAEGDITISLGTSDTVSI